LDHHDLETGITIGDFQIEQRLGSGGMGIVYRARQVSLGRLVALKVLGPALYREADRHRFQREAQAIAKLNHPGIAGVHFIGQDRQVCFMAMEFIDGLTLRQVIDRLATSHDAALTIDIAIQNSHPDDAEAREERFDQPTGDHVGGAERPPGASPGGAAILTPAAKMLRGSQAYLNRCCEVGIEAALALAHAHERGVVHRDIKPENILIDRQGRVHLIDFGVARFLEDVTLTNTGALIGTPMYMSPEQVTGRLELDRRTDIYSLGMVLYELLTLARPITAPTREGVLRQIVTKAMPPASWRNPALPRGLESVLHKAIARDPDDRYQAASDLAADLRRCLDGQPVVAPPYRYRLDPREIKAERPAGIMVLAFGHFLAAALAALMALWMAFTLVAMSSPAFRELLRSRDLNDVSGPDARAGLLSGIVVALALATALSSIGFGLLAAKRWARWAAIAVSSLVGAWALFESGRLILDGHLFAALGFDFPLLAFAGATIAYLWRRSVRNWFHLAAHLRVESRRAHGSLQGPNAVRR
jgi:serine/threonine protein kinase